MAKYYTIFLLLIAVCLGREPYSRGSGYSVRADLPAYSADRSFHLGLSVSSLVGTGPLGPDVTGSVIEEADLGVYTIKNFREDWGYLWGLEVGGFLRLPDGERIELLVAFAKTSASLTANYDLRQESDSVMTYRRDSLAMDIIEVTPRLRLSAALPYGLEPYIGLGLACDFFTIEELYEVDGIFEDSLGGEFTADFTKTTDLYATGLDLLLGMKVRITDNVACHLEADGVFMPNKDIELDDIDNTAYPVDSDGNPRKPLEIDLFPREHRVRLLHVTARFGIEVSFDVN